MRIKLVKREERVLFAKASKRVVIVTVGKQKMINFCLLACYNPSANITGLRCQISANCEFSMFSSQKQLSSHFQGNAGSEYFFGELAQ
jgi:hypothetical protein